MYGIPDSVKPLSAAEEQVMLAVWACRAPVTRRDIDAKLRAKAGPRRPCSTFFTGWRRKAG